MYAAHHCIVLLCVAMQAELRHLCSFSVCHPIVLSHDHGCGTTWQTIVLSYYCPQCICNSHCLATLPGLLCHMTDHCSQLLLSSMYMQFPLSCHFVRVAMPYERPLFSATIVFYVYAIPIFLPYDQDCYVIWHIIVLTYYFPQCICNSHCLTTWLGLLCHMRDHCSLLLLSWMYTPFPLSCHIVRVAMPHNRSLYLATLYMTYPLFALVMQHCLQWVQLVNLQTMWYDR